MAPPKHLKSDLSHPQRDNRQRNNAKQRTEQLVADDTQPPWQQTPSSRGDYRVKEDIEKLTTEASVRILDNQPAREEGLPREARCAGTRNWIWEYFVATAPGSAHSAHCSAIHEERDSTSSGKLGFGERALRCRVNESKGLARAEEISPAPPILAAHDAPRADRKVASTSGSWRGGVGEYAGINRLCSTYKSNKHDR